MKLQLLPPSTPSTPTPNYQDEIERLYERLTTNAYSDSESFRQTILGRMILLTFQSVTK